MELQTFLTRLKTDPESIEFDDSMAIIDHYYDFSPTAFTNGDCHNEAGQNNGSCKILAFARLNDLSQEETLSCFGKFYREEVLGNPEGDSHQNIRNFMQYGWDRVEFQGAALSPKT